MHNELRFLVLCRYVGDGSHGATRKDRPGIALVPAEALPVSGTFNPPIRETDLRGLVQGAGVPREEGHRQFHRRTANEGAVGQAQKILPFFHSSIGFVDSATPLLGVAFPTYLVLLKFFKTKSIKF